MVKGISRQVIVVHSPEPKLFEQAIFILKDDVGDGAFKRSSKSHPGKESGAKASFLPLWGCVGRRRGDSHRNRMDGHLVDLARKSCYTGLPGIRVTHRKERIL